MSTASNKSRFLYLVLNYDSIVTLYSMVVCTSHHSRLVDENLDPITKTTSRRRLLFGIIVYLAAIGTSFVYIELSVFVFALILISAFMPNKIMFR